MNLNTDFVIFTLKRLHLYVVTILTDDFFPDILLVEFRAMHDISPEGMTDMLTGMLNEESIVASSVDYLFHLTCSKFKYQSSCKIVPMFRRRGFLLCDGPVRENVTFNDERLRPFEFPTAEGWIPYIKIDKKNIECVTSKK